MSCGIIPRKQEHICKKMSQACHTLKKRKLEMTQEANWEEVALGSGLRKVMKYLVA